nr:uncharacterized mitochondrial protein AtMg00810-like [Tanacetum cinerariifolium]
ARDQKCYKLHRGGGGQSATHNPTTAVAVAGKATAVVVVTAVVVDSCEAAARGQIDKTLFIKKVKGDILLVQVYVDDIIFGSTNKVLCTEFEKMMQKKFQLSSIGELTFFLGLQVTQKEEGSFISEDKYVDEILKKFGFSTVRTASTPMEISKPLMKDENTEYVDVHLYRSMIGSLMYLTSLRLDIMFAVCACARFQVTPNVLHLHAVKRIFRYLKGQPKLGLWYPKDSPFDLEAYTNYDYAGASLDRKSTTRGCQFLRSRLISWQCKKQSVVASSTIEAEKTKIKVTEIPQSSEPTNLDAYEGVHEERGDNVERAVTTSASLDAEQENGTINRTQSTTIPIVPFPQGFGAGGRPRSQETMRNRPAQTRVFDLETTKNAQAKEIINFKKRVKRLERTRQSRTPGVKLFKIDMNDVFKDVEGDAEQVISDAADQVSTGDTVNTADEDVIISQTLVKMRSEKSKARGVVMKELSETATRPTVPPQKHDPKDKDSFVSMDTKVVKERAEVSQIRAKGSFKRAGEDLQQESTKIQKVDDDDKEKEDLKQCFEIIPEEEVAINAIPLAIKPAPIVEKTWKIYGRWLRLNVDIKCQKKHMKEFYGTIEEKVDTSKAINASLVDNESSGTKSKEQDTSSRSRNDAHADDVDTRPIYDEEPMAEKSRMELYIMNKQDGRMILNSVQNRPLIWPTIKENGVIRLRKYPELTHADAIQADCDVKATNIIFQGGDPIDAINHMMSSLSTVVTSRYPTTNNQLRDSSNPRQQATINDGRVTLQLAQGRQISFATDLGITEGQATQTVITHNAAYQVDDLDAYDSDLDELNTAKVVLMVNLSRYGLDALAKKAQKLEPNLYDGNVIKSTSAIVIPDSKDTLMLAEERGSKTLLKQHDPMVLEKKVNTTPVDYANSMNSLDPSPSCRHTKVKVPKQLPKVSINFRNSSDPNPSCRPTKFEVLKELFKGSMEKDLVITALEDELRKLKGKDLADNTITKHTIAPEMLKVDVEPLAPRLLNNRT